MLVIYIERRAGVSSVSTFLSSLFQEFLGNRNFPGKRRVLRGHIQWVGTPMARSTPHACFREGRRVGLKGSGRNCSLSIHLLLAINLISSVAYGKPLIKSILPEMDNSEEVLTSEQEDKILGDDEGMDVEGTGEGDVLTSNPATTTNPTFPTTQTPTGTGEVRPPRRRLSGAARRRKAKINAEVRKLEDLKLGSARFVRIPPFNCQFRTLVKGIYFTISGEAGEVRPQPGEKRGRNTPPSTSDRPRKRPPIRPPPSVGARCVYFRKKEDPTERISPSELNIINGEFRAAIDALEGATLIKINGIRINSGFVEVQCEDETTAIWVEGEIERMNNNAYKVYPAEEVRVPIRTVGAWIREPNPPRADNIFGTITKQNGGLDTSRWHLIKAIRKGPGHFVLMGMDEESVEKIKPPNKIYYYTDLLSFTFQPTKGKQGT